jgi:transcriptional regulator with XRE-family HTH domain
MSLPGRISLLRRCRTTVVLLSASIRGGYTSRSATIAPEMFALELKQVTRTMKVNTTRVADLRKQRSWSQDELATAAGLNLRTVQRIEAEGTASLQSLKAIASALQTDLLDLKYIPESRMRKFEYKTVVLPFRMGIFKQGLPDIQTALNKEGQQGWRFTQMVLPSTEWGKSDSMVAILERAVDE